MNLSTQVKRESKNNLKKSQTSQGCLMLVIVICLSVLTGCAWLKSSPVPKKVLEVRPGILQGYLSLDKAPNSLTLLPAPPANDSAAFAADQEAFSATRPLIGGPRWAQAAMDANLRFPESPEAFACALNAPITRKDMPNLYMLMQRTLTDAAYATFAAKNNYKRTRPFVVNKEPSCTPNEEAALAKDGSYPSGHSSIGWAWALILAEIAPDRADAILSRGYAFGQSRVICGVHWQSDVHAGRVIAAAVVAKLHADRVFLAQLAAAKKELTAARAKRFKPENDCQAEAAALTLR